MTSRELTSGFDFWLRGHLRMAVMHLPVKFGADIGREPTISFATHLRRVALKVYSSQKNELAKTILAV